MRASSEPEDKDLVERARDDGDMDAFEALYRRYVERIHAFAYRRSGSSAVADDVTSATFERALRHLPGFRWRGGGFSAWLYRIAATQLAEHHRARRRELEAAPRLHTPPMESFEDAVVEGMEARVLREAIGRLNPRYQRAVSLSYLSGLSTADAAAAMGVPRTVMAVTLHRALRALARQLGSAT